MPANAKFYLREHFTVSELPLTYSLTICVVHRQNAPFCVLGPLCLGKRFTGTNRFPSPKSILLTYNRRILNPVAMIETKAVELRKVGLAGADALASQIVADSMTTCIAKGVGGLCWVIELLHAPAEIVVAFVAAAHVDVVPAIAIAIAEVPGVRYRPFAGARILVKRIGILGGGCIVGRVSHHVAIAEIPRA